MKIPENHCFKVKYTLSFSYSSYSSSLIFLNDKKLENNPGIPQTDSFDYSPELIINLRDSFQSQYFLTGREMICINLF